MIYVIILITIILVIIILLYYLIKSINNILNLKKQLNTNIDVLTYKRNEILILIEGVGVEILKTYNITYNEACKRNTPKLWALTNYYREILKELNLKYFCLTGKNYISFGDIQKKKEVEYSLN
jgi:hypothetical protein